MKYFMNDAIFGKSREVSLPLRLKILFGSYQIQGLYGFICLFSTPFLVLIKKYVAGGKIDGIISLSIVLVSIILVLLFELKYHLKAISLLANGRITIAEITKVNNIMGRHSKNGITHYEFEDKNGKKYSSIIKFHRRGIQDEGNTDILFYDANNPKKNVLKNNLCIDVSLEKDNTFKSPSLSEGLALLILPFIAFCMILTSIIFAILYL